MRKLMVIAAMMLPALSAYASGGTWDGIYECNLSAAGRSYPAYITVNGQTNGQAIFGVLAVSESTSLYGFGVGQVSGPQFAGTTMFNLPFKMHSSPLGFTGTVGIIFSGVPVTATASCTKIW